MNRIPVTSSNIASAGYTNDTLEVEFRGGKVYRYLGVSEDIFKNFMTAESKGKFFYSEIRGKYSYGLVRPESAEDESKDSGNIS